MSSLSPKLFPSLHSSACCSTQHSPCYFYHSMTSPRILRLHKPLAPNILLQYYFTTCTIQVHYFTTTLEQHFFHVHSLKFLKDYKILVGNEYILHIVIFPPALKQACTLQKQSKAVLLIKKVNIFESPLSKTMGQ